ncbi:phosphatidate phosphatase LPIN2-like isoform X1 [Branchiostoma lanceolatum]|uniref:phosphatidate phosphatase LPIN2-like isoform X1 n=1 Tax=Branchiostoma lanceolatum TaxID=7740 RepID=UPI00345531E3
MNYFGRFLSNFKEFYNEINAATLTGAIDIVVVQQEDGSYSCSPFHVRFGKMGVLHSREKVVDVTINGQNVGLQMKLGEAGEAFFVQESSDGSLVPFYLATSPIPSGAEELMEEGVRRMKEDQSFVEELFRHVGVQTDITARNLKLSAPGKSESESKSESGSSAEKVTTIQVLSPEEDKRKSGSSLDDFTTPSDEIRSIADQLKEPDGASNDRPTTPKAIPGPSDAEEKKHNSVLVQTDAVDLGAMEKLGKVEVEFQQLQVSDGDESDLGDDERKGTSDNSARKRKMKRRSRNELRRESPRSEQKEEGVFTIDLGEEEEIDFAKNVHVQALVKEEQSRPDIYPYSDGDATPAVQPSSPVGSRPPTPKSDTEVELQRRGSITQTQGEMLTWNWGELPQGPHAVASNDLHFMPIQSAQEQDSLSVDGVDSAQLSSSAQASPKPGDEGKPSMLGGVFQFMRRPSSRKEDIEGGLYLDDLESGAIDPEVAALYFPKTTSHQAIKTAKDSLKEEDNFSEQSSLPQSPHSFGGASGGFDSGTETNPIFIVDEATEQVVDPAMSLCGGLTSTDKDIPDEKFMSAIVTHKDLCENPNILNHPDLVLRIEGKYYNWKVAAPTIMSYVMFQQPLPDLALSRLTEEHLPAKKEEPKKEESGRLSSWFSWRRSHSEQEGTGAQKSVSSATSSPITSAENSPMKHDVKPRSRDSTSDSEQEGQMKRERRDRRPSGKKLKKVTRLTSEQISKLNLQPGANEIVFSVTTRYQGTSRCKATIFLWQHDEKIVVSDIDGTITRSDVFGQVLPVFGKDWSQVGVAHLYDKIHQNGYKFLYLSSRAIGQARATREYLHWVQQGDIKLPKGPLLLAPSSLIVAFQKELIERKPEEFKISCLKDIQALFPPACNPFFAGFGNKVNDVWAYRAVDVPISRIFTVNHKGIVKQDGLPGTTLLNKGKNGTSFAPPAFQSSYSSLSGMVDHFFPALDRGRTTEFEKPSEYSLFTYWREPLPDISGDIDLGTSPQDPPAEKEKEKATEKSK